MRSNPDASQSFITIYKAPQKDKAQKILELGFLPDDFPYNPPYLDGQAYFAGPNDRSIAEEFNQSYRGGVIEVAIAKHTYERVFLPLEYCYDTKDGCKRFEVVIPHDLFPLLNQFQRVLKPR